MLIAGKGQTKLVLISLRKKIHITLPLYGLWTVEEPDKTINAVLNRNEKGKNMELPS